jgi:hypothetical protein
MKYAIIGPRGVINRISETEPKNVAEGASIVEVSDENAALVQEGKNQVPVVRYFWIEGELKTAEEAQAIRAAIRIANRPRPFVTAEQWIESKGFGPMRLITLLDLELKLFTTQKSAQKITAVRTWLDGIQVAFAADPIPKNDWLEPPYGFEETAQDALAALVS